MGEPVTPKRKSFFSAAKRREEKKRERAKELAAMTAPPLRSRHRIPASAESTGSADRDYFRAWYQQQKDIERSRAQNRERQRRYRERQKALDPAARLRRKRAQAYYSMDYARLAASRSEVPPGFSMLVDPALLSQEQILAAWEYFLYGRIKPD